MGNSQGFGNHHLAYRFGPVSPCQQLGADVRPSGLQHLCAGLYVQPVHTRRSPVGFNPLPCLLQVLSRQRRLQQAACACHRLCRPCAWVLMERTSSFVTGRLTPSFTGLPLCRPGLPRHLTHDLAVFHVFSHSLTFGPSWFPSCLIGPVLPLLRPLLTSRSGLHRRPFSHKARSPRVSTHTFTAQSPHLRLLALVTRALQIGACSPCLAAPSMKFLFIDSRLTLHASFPHSVALMQLRFTLLAVTSLQRDFHPQVRAHAGRTPTNGSGRG
jgi:hypothetical protein